MPNRLYIIGNGFDLHHGLRSRYWDFKNYLEQKDHDLIEKLEEYFPADELWSDFEETLAGLDADQIADENINYLVSYGADDWSDANHHDYQFEIQQSIDLITVDLKKRFTEWVLELKLPDNAAEQKIDLDNKSRFINFNYTDTLQRLYNVPTENIFYIHNQAINTDSTLILGHSRDPQANKKLSELNDEDTDPRIAEGNEIIDSYFEKTYKSTGTIIKENSSLFDSLSDVTEIYVLGHSLSKVDLPYFKELLNRIDTSTVQWTVSYYDDNALAHHREMMNQLGIDANLIEFVRLADLNLNSRQIHLF